MSQFILKSFRLLRSEPPDRSEEHTSELQSHHDLVCRLLLEKKNAVDDDRRQGQTHPVKEQVMDVMQGIEKLTERNGALTGIYSDFSHLHSITATRKPPKTFV